MLRCAVLWPAAPFSDIYRGMALIGVKGFSALPKHCATLMLVFFVSGVGVLCVLQQSLQLWTLQTNRLALLAACFATSLIALDVMDRQGL